MEENLNTVRIQNGTKMRQNQIKRAATRRERTENTVVKNKLFVGAHTGVYPCDESHSLSDHVQDESFQELHFTW